PLAPGSRRRGWCRGSACGAAPPFVLPAPAGPRGEAVELSGKIDRVDLDDAGRAVVVDYKYAAIGRYSNLDEKIASGADLQLPIYALAARRLLGREVVAAGYLTLRDDKRRWLR